MFFDITYRHIDENIEGRHNFFLRTCVCVAAAACSLQCVRGKKKEEKCVMILLGLVINDAVLSMQ